MGETSKNTEKDAKWPIPFNISIDKFDLISKALFQVEADKNPISGDSLSQRIGIHVRTLNSNLSFLKEIGIITEPESNMFSLTPEGSKYAKALTSNDKNTLQTTLNEIFSKSIYKALMDFINLRKDLDLNYELLYSQIKTMARLKENEKYPRGLSAPYDSGVRTLIDHLIRANIIKENIKNTREDVKSVKSSNRSKKVEKEDLEEEKNLVPIKNEDVKQQTIENKESTGVSYNITITVVANDAESIRELIPLLKELNSYKEEK